MHEGKAESIPYRHMGISPFNRNFAPPAVDNALMRKPLSLLFTHTVADGTMVVDDTALTNSGVPQTDWRLLAFFSPT